MDDNFSHPNPNWLNYIKNKNLRKSKAFSSVFCHDIQKAGLSDLIAVIVMAHEKKVEPTF